MALVPRGQIDLKSQDFLCYIFVFIFVCFASCRFTQIHMLIFFPSDDRNHRDKHRACVSLSSCLKFSEAVGTASERQSMLLQLSGQGSWLRCGSQRAVAMLCHTAQSTCGALSAMQLVPIWMGTAAVVCVKFLLPVLPIQTSGSI